MNRILRQIGHFFGWDLSCLCSPWLLHFGNLTGDGSESTCRSPEMIGFPVPSWMGMRKVPELARKRLAEIVATKAMEMIGEIKHLSNLLEPWPCQSSLRRFVVGAKRKSRPVTMMWCDIRAIVLRIDTVLAIIRPEIPVNCFQRNDTHTGIRNLRRRYPRSPEVPGLHARREAGAGGRRRQIPFARRRTQGFRGRPGAAQDCVDRVPVPAHWEAFYNGPTYRGLKAIGDACSSARLVGVDGTGQAPGGGTQAATGPGIVCPAVAPIFGRAPSGSRAGGESIASIGTPRQNAIHLAANHRAQNVGIIVAPRR